MYEDPQDAAAAVCTLCLNADRRLSSLKSLSYANEILTDMQVCLRADSVVCWECRAMLCKIRNFKIQVQRANQILEDGCTSTNSRTLSNLGVTAKLTYDFVFTDDSEFDENKQELMKNESLDGTWDAESAGVYVCEVCSSRFAREEALEAHRSAHNTLYRCREPGCRLTNTCVLNVQTHCAVHEPKKDIIKREAYTCPVCGTSFCGAESLSAHRQSHESDCRYECDICTKTFTTRRQIQIHVNVHTMRAMCDVCGKRLPNQRRLKLHSLAHLDQSHRAYECAECHKRFIDKYKLLVHSRQHTGEKPFKCEICSTKYVSKEQLTYHFKKHHTDGAVRKEYKPRTKTLYRNERICYAKQQSQFHRKVDAKQETKDGKYECNVCGKLLTTQQNLQTHYGVHSTDRPYRCDVCDKTFKYRPQLCTHKQKHSGEKSHQCNVCGARFTFKAILSNHMKSHSSEKPYRCEICDLTFKYKSGLWTHKLIHKGEKPHQCSICGSRFTLKGNLTGHMKTHTNEKPYECTVCGRKFPWRRNLRNHYKTHAKEQRVQGT